MNPAKKQRVETKLDDCLLLRPCSKANQHHLVYFCAILGCDVPIIEALFYSRLSCFAVNDVDSTNNVFTIRLGDYIFYKLQFWNHNEFFRVISHKQNVQIKFGGRRYTWSWDKQNNNRICWNDSTTVSYDGRRFEDILDEFLEIFKK